MQGNTFAKLLVTRIRSFDLKCDLRNETKAFHIANLFFKKRDWMPSFEGYTKSCARTVIKIRKEKAFFTNILWQTECPWP